MDRRNDSNTRQGAGVSPFSPGSRLLGEEQQRQRPSLPDSPARRYRTPLQDRHSRSSSSSSVSEVVQFGGPNEQLLLDASFPILADSFVQRAIQFCMILPSILETLLTPIDVRDYAPTATQRPHFTGVGPDVSLLRKYIPFVLHDRMVLCAVVAMSSLGANIAATGCRERSSETLRFYHLAVSMLRKRLQDESERASDAVVVTLSHLCGFEVSDDSPLSRHRHTDSDRCAFQAMAGNYDAVDMHARGIKQVVALRGGPDRLGSVSSTSSLDSRSV